MTPDDLFFRCDTLYEKSKINPHTNELYFDFCHPADDQKLSCFDSNFCEDVASEIYAEDVQNGEYTLCKSPDAPLRQRCHAAPMASGGTTVIGEEIIFMDLRDTVCQVTEALAQAATSDWISPATKSTDVTVVLYNGELGIYSIVDLSFQFSKRGGQIDTQSKILTAEVPIRTAWWSIYEMLFAVMCFSVIGGEFGELYESCSSCRCFSTGGYFRDFWNILDWSVCLLFFGQAVLWGMLEFVWYPQTYALLQLDGCEAE